MARVVERVLAESDVPVGSAERRRRRVAATDERDRDPLLDLDDPKGTPPERRLRDGEAGAGDMLGGLGAGAGDRLGPEPTSRASTRRTSTGSTSRNRPRTRP